jgi:hypothetical protein
MSIQVSVSGPTVAVATGDESVDVTVGSAAVDVSVTEAQGPAGPAGGVASVNGQTGVVVLNAAAVGAVPLNGLAAMTGPLVTTGLTFAVGESPVLLVSDALVVIDGDFECRNILCNAIDTQDNDVNAGGGRFLGDGSQLTGRSFTHTQSSAAGTWTVNHNLGTRPQVEVRSPGGVVVWAEVTHVTTSQCVVSFSGPQTGTAHCSI